MLVYDFYKYQFKQGLKSHYDTIKKQTKDEHFGVVARGVSTVLILLNFFNVLDNDDVVMYQNCADCNTDLSTLIVPVKDLEPLYEPCPSGVI
eukprot:Pgem_evm2s15623